MLKQTETIAILPPSGINNGHIPVLLVSETEFTVNMYNVGNFFDDRTLVHDPYSETIMPFGQMTSLKIGRAQREWLHAQPGGRRIAALNVFGYGEEGTPEPAVEIHPAGQTVIVTPLPLDAAEIKM